MNFMQYTFDTSRFETSVHDIGRKIKTLSKEARKLFERVKPGDGLEIDRGFYRHYGVYIGDNLIVELNGDTKGKNKSRVITIDTFLSKNKDSDVKIHRTHKFSPEEIIQRAKNAINAIKIPYNLVTNNCEHFMEEILNGKHESHQVRGAIAYTGLISKGINRRLDKFNHKNADKKREFYRNFL